MAEAKAKAGTSAKAKAKAPAAKAKAGTSAKKRAPRKTSRTTVAPKKGRVDSAAELSDDVLEAVESGQRAAIDAVHRFLETVDEALPALGERPSRREKVIDAALEMADRLTTTQYEFLRTVVRSAEKSLSKPEAK